MMTQAISWPEISLTKMMRDNRLYACQSIPLPLGKQSWELYFPPSLPLSYEPRKTLIFDILDHTAIVELERLPFSEEVKAILGEVQLNDLPEALQAALLAELLAEPLNHMSNLLGGPAKFIAIEESRYTNHGEYEEIPFALKQGLEPIQGRLFMVSADWPRLFKTLESQVCKPKENWGHLPMTVRRILGFTSLSIEEATDLDLGDLIFLDTAFEGETIGLLLPENQLWRARQDHNIILEEAMAMPENHQTDPHNPLENPTLQLVFEVGRQEIRLNELRQLGPGSIIATEKSLGDGIAIYVNGQNAGHGELVAVGETLAVRILELYSQKAADSLAEVVS